MNGFKIILLICAIFKLTEQKLITKVVNGNPTVSEKYPFFAFGGCGGSIIHERYILSAAHCYHGQSPSNIVFHVGLEHRSNTTGSVAYQAESLFIKTNNTLGTGIPAPDDFALIKVSQPIVFNSRAQPIKLNHKIELKTNQPFSSLGFGVTETGGASEDLRLGNFAIGDYYGTVFKSTYTPVGLGGGDSGGPDFIFSPCTGFIQIGINIAIATQTVNGTTLNSAYCAAITSETCAWLKQKSNNQIQC